MKDRKINKEENSLTKFNFDLYTRNYYISNIIDLILKNEKTGKILDVGGREGRLKEFLDEKVELNILDIRDSKSDESGYIKGDILRTDLPDSSFDVVTSAELLEHIKEEDRQLALEQMFRISRRAVILSAPFYSPEVETSESIVNNYYRNLFGEFHPWLREHAESKLPDKRVLENFAREKKGFLFNFGSNPLYIWTLIYLFTFSNKYEGDEFVNKVNNFYNENFLNLGDTIGPSYRQIFVILKKKDLLGELERLARSQRDESKIAGLEELIFSGIGNSVQKNEQIKKEQQEEIKKLQKVIKEREKELDLIFLRDLGN